MSKIKYYILGGIFFCLAVGIIIPSINPTKAETTSTTFPVDEAGIAAYVKVDNIENIDITVLAEAYSTIEKQAESYVIGRVPVTNNPLVYVGLDGWIVAYFLNTEEASRITGGTKATTLEDAIDYICEKTGLSYSTPIKYYDFEFPEANKMTLITERLDGISYTVEATNGFYVTVPGILYEASYRVYGRSGHYLDSRLILKVDGTSIFEKDVQKYSVFYGYYDSSTYFKTGVTHYVMLECSFSPCCTWGYCVDSGFATALIYKN